MAVSIILAAITLLPPQQALDRALDAVEPPPALRAAFRATLSSEKAVRRIEYDPYGEPGSQFRITLKQGKDEELDAIVEGWRAERQADVRLFADDLRESLGEARAQQQGQGLLISFRHQISPNDGPVDAMISSQMTGQLSFDEKTGFLTAINYSIERPVKLDDGTTLRDYRQTYRFDYSETWGVSYVTSYELEASGGRWGVEQTRRFRVSLTDVAFGLAGDARQEIASKPYPSTRTTASLGGR